MNRSPSQIEVLPRWRAATLRLRLPFENQSAERLQQIDLQKYRLESSFWTLEQ